MRYSCRRCGARAWCNVSLRATLIALVTLKNVDINPTIAGRQARIDIAQAEITQFNANLPKRDLNKLGLYYEGKDLGPVLRKVSADAFFQHVDREFDNLIKSIPPCAPAIPKAM